MAVHKWEKWQTENVLCIPREGLKLGFPFELIDSRLGCLEWKKTVVFEQVWVSWVPMRMVSASGMFCRFSL